MKKSMLYPEGLKTKGSSDSGRYFYHVILPDGRLVGLHADKVLITDTGDLLAVSNSQWSKESAKYESLEYLRVILAMANGEWVSFYQATILDGTPIGIDWVEKDLTADID